MRTCVYDSPVCQSGLQKNSTDEKGPGTLLISGRGVRAENGAKILKLRARAPNLTRVFSFVCLPFFVVFFSLGSFFLLFLTAGPLPEFCDVLRYTSIYHNL